jgi:hypothetical protein
VDWVWELRCKVCERTFEICRCCYTGQRYCGDSCREQERAEQLRQAQTRYAQTNKGKAAIARAQAHYRECKTSPGGNRVAELEAAAGVTPPAPHRQLKEDCAVSVAAPASSTTATSGARVALALLVPTPSITQITSSANSTVGRDSSEDARWSTTVHWLRFVIDQTLPSRVDSKYFDVRRGCCQLCGHVGPLVSRLAALRERRC